MASTTPSAAPGRPALLRPTFHPISATNSTFGPGAACAIAIEALNWLSVSQWRLSTRKRCMSGAVVMAPPTESSESDTKCRKSVNQSLPASGVLMQPPACGT